ncbi:MAG TPA: hypothetical protein VJW73_18945 [Gemmatimonadaceae bacterium]|nr:hypothetical protein [Gemmatimonadaceae bacterium]
MYSSCIFCHSSLGSNEAIDAFPVGRRLAFDPDRGRLWVVCLHCRQWNLSPLEERWEAVEQCERRFRATRVRVSTDEIGLARLREGLDLVRIGRPQRPEFAAWRYGEQLGRRRIRAFAVAGGLTVVGGAAVVGGAMAGLFALLPTFFWFNAHKLPGLAYQKRVIARIPAGGIGAFRVRAADAEKSRLQMDGDGSWWLLLHHANGERYFEGSQAIRATSHLMAGINSFGATRSQVGGAVDLLEDAADPQRFFLRVAQRSSRLGDLTLPMLPPEVRLALEMSAHEEAERRALEGELAALAEAWRAAEAVASIADNMFVPASFAEMARKSDRRHDVGGQ